MRKLTKVQEVEIAKAVEAGATVKDQAAIYSVPVARIYRVLANLRKPVAPTQEVRRRPRCLDDAQEQRLVAFYCEGHTLREVGKRFEISHQAVLDILRRRGVDVRCKRQAWEIKRE